MNNDFEVVVEVFLVAGAWNWSVVQNFGDENGEALAYGYDDDRQSAFAAAGAAIKELWE